MREAQLLLPDFLLIALGLGLARATPLARPVWDGVERLVYYLLFPALLFTGIVRSPLAPSAAAPLLGATLAVCAAGIGAAYLLKLAPRLDAHFFASGAQAAFRFNSYIGLALAQSLAGAEGLAGMALMLAVAIPVVNVAAVWPLARQRGGALWRELLSNPLIIATLGALAFNAIGLRLPDFALATLSRLGSAALPLGLMAVGAGLTFGPLREAPGLAAALMGIRHLLLPAVGIGLALVLALPGAQPTLLVIFAAMPTASSAYVLAVRMGGNGAFVAGLVTLSTVLAMAGLPLALTALRSVH
jgi:predicted permease